MKSKTDRIPDSQIARDITRVAERLGQQTLSRSEYLQHGQFSEYQIYDGGRTWEALCKIAGVRSKKNEPVPDDVYLQRLEKAVAELGRLPRTSERKRYGLNFSKRRYPTLAAFIETAVELRRIPDRLLPKQSPGPSPGRSTLGESRPLHSDSSTSDESRPVAPIPLDTSRRRWERTGIEGFPYAPQDELGVVALFSILCSKGAIRWQITELRGGRGIDATCHDHVMRRDLRVEFKHTLSRGGWNHRLDEVDDVVCWENRWPDFPKPVIVLRDLIAE